MGKTQRDFCKPFPLSKELKDTLDKLPKMEFSFNNNGDCFVYIDNKLVCIERKNGTIIVSK